MFIAYFSLMIFRTAGVLVTINDFFNVIERTWFPVIRNSQATFITNFTGGIMRLPISIDGICLDFYLG
ncbi:hypothetical protein AU504_00940 [Lonsdalea populi]|nr:hypothetical protein AU508_07820 [Lonsdalea populi]RAT73316.1 hypothetical protein AU504_00940 [Lonsdalea populi]RAT74545.1 hypothetical protein AU506_12275 [Lonsdalea populi]